MLKNANVSVPREITEKYIKCYYKSAYLIDEAIQPKFWEAVILLCENANADVSGLIDSSPLAQYCIKEFGERRATVSKVDKEAKDVNQLAKNVADSIRESESTDVSKLEFFLMKKRLKSMEHNMKLLSSRL